LLIFLHEPVVILKHIFARLFLNIVEGVIYELYFLFLSLRLLLWHFVRGWIFEYFGHLGFKHR